MDNGGLNQETSQKTTETDNNNETINSSKTDEVEDSTSEDQDDKKLTAQLIAKKPEKYYGQEVKNYTKGDRVYRIFYVDIEGYFGDKNTIYLKADWVADDTDLKKQGQEIIEYTPKTTEVLEKMNKEWAKQRINANDQWHRNENWAAWMCDPTTEDPESNQAWADYFDESKANYVIGSPSIEMFVKSYNQVSHEIGKKALGTKYKAQYPYGYYYTLDGEETSSIASSNTGDDTVDYKGYNNLYCGKEKPGTSTFEWLTSPSCYGYNCNCVIDRITASLKVGTYNSINGFSPIVSLKADFTPEI